ncbi:MAG TPA: hypothetical protein P5195_05125, partial [Anaerolineae bacterium]|nr:hypothetical protein [Anaerolineae bacterium]
MGLWRSCCCLCGQIRSQHAVLPFGGTEATWPAFNTYPAAAMQPFDTTWTPTQDEMFALLSGGSCGGSRGVGPNLTGVPTDCTSDTRYHKMRVTIDVQAVAMACTLTDEGASPVHEVGEYQSSYEIEFSALDGEKIAEGYWRETAP